MIVPKWKDRASDGSEGEHTPSLLRINLRKAKMGSTPRHQPDPALVMCPLCGAEPGEPCSIPATVDAAGMFVVPHHLARQRAANRQVRLDAQPTRPL